MADIGRKGFGCETVAMELPRLLATLQFSSVEEGVYRVVIERPCCTLRELAARCGAPEPIVRAAVAHLVERQLLRVEHDVVEAVDPQDSLTALADELRHRASAVLDELSEVSRGIGALSRRYAERRLGSVAVEKLPDADSVRTVIASVNQRVRTEVRNMQRISMAPDTLGPGQRMTAAALARGVRVRSLYAPSTLAEPQQRDAAAPLRELGSEVRTGPTPFQRLLICDLDLALLRAEADADSSTFMIKDSSFVLTLANHFDYCWQLATPALEKSKPVSARQLRMLQLLAAGAADAAVARECGMSPRQLTRDLASLMAATNTSTRFALAVEAVRRGWT